MLLQGLRLHDNPALLEASQNVDHMYPIFILDPHFVNPDKVGVNRMQFLLESLADLDSNLKARGSRLLVLQGPPIEVLTTVMDRWSPLKLCFEMDTEPYALSRDQAAREAARSAGVEVYSPVSHTLYDLSALIERAGGHPPLSMKRFEALIEDAGDPPAPVDDPASKLPSVPSDSDVCVDDQSLVPTLSELGYSVAATSPFKGGESAALARMADYLSDKDWVASFEKPKGNPATFFPHQATTVLSPYLKFGCLSSRLFHAKIVSIYRQKKEHTKPPVSLRGQLLWREFFYCVSFGVPRFDQMKGNPICKQIDWDNNADFVRAWEESRTGYPWIDAIMAQLRRDGWMHHLARHAVACFLTRGDLYCSWEAGRDIFDKYLIDADWALNNANWMWLSASAFFSQYFRVYSPITFGRQYDKAGDFIREYLPVLKDMPAKYIYEPWKAPKDVQEEAGCIIGKDYPMPIVEHASVMKTNMGRMKTAYASQPNDGAAALMMTHKPPPSGTGWATKRRRRE